MVVEKLFFVGERTKAVESDSREKTVRNAIVIAAT